MGATGTNSKDFKIAIKLCAIEPAIKWRGEAFAPTQPESSGRVSA
jgi:hypothetical protein